jgi:hypothetical protein
MGNAPGTFLFAVILLPAWGFNYSGRSLSKHLLANHFGNLKSRLV